MLSAAFLCTGRLFCKSISFEKGNGIPLRCSSSKFYSKYNFKYYIDAIFWYVWSGLGQCGDLLFTQTCFLGWKLNNFTIKSFMSRDTFCLVSIFLATLVMFLFLCFLGMEVILDEGKIKGILSLAIIIPVSVFIYGDHTFFCGFPEVTRFLAKNRDCFVLISVGQR